MSALPPSYTPPTHDRRSVEPLPGSKPLFGLPDFVVFGLRFTAASLLRTLFFHAFINAFINALTESLGR